MKFLRNPGYALLLTLLSTFAAASPTVIDVMVVHTQELHSLTDAWIAQAIDETNVAYGNNNVPIRLRYVGRHETSYVEPSSNTSSNLGQTVIYMQDPEDGIMDDVPIARNDVGADVVIFATTHHYACGSAFGIASNGPAAPDWAFVAISTGCWSGQYVLAHEMGHTMGAMHVTSEPNIMSTSANTTGLFVQETKDAMAIYAPVVAEWRATVVPLEPPGC
jgi:hypothetical protein